MYNTIQPSAYKRSKLFTTKSQRTVIPVTERLQAIVFSLWLFIFRASTFSGLSQQHRVRIWSNTTSEGMDDGVLYLILGFNLVQFGNSK